MLGKASSPAPAKFPITTTRKLRLDGEIFYSREGNVRSNLRNHKVLLYLHNLTMHQSIQMM